MKTISLLAVVALAVPFGLFAGDEMQSKFDALDADGDGYVSVIEAEGQLDLLQRWVDVDKNSDGQIEESEFSAFEIAPAFIQDDSEDDETVGAAPN